MSRYVIAVAIVLLAVISAPRLQLDYAPHPALPELRVSLRIAGGAADPEELTTRWVIPIESAIRSLGDVRATRADVNAADATIVVRFDRGTDVEVKAARLASELSALRAKLPRGSRLGVWPAAQGGEHATAVIALPGAADAERIADELRAARGVRDVWTYGVAEREIEVAMKSASVPASAVAEAIRETAPRSLGTLRAGTRKVPVVALPRTEQLSEIQVRTGASTVRLGAVADVRQRPGEARTLARVNGKPAVALALSRDADVSLFVFDRSVRERLHGVAWDEISSEATELRSMLTRVGSGALAAAILLAAIGFAFARWRGLTLALYVPLSVAIAMNVFRLASMAIDAQTILVACIAIAGVAPFAVWRGVARRRERWPALVGAAFVLLLPLAATYGSAALAPVLAAPSRAFVVCALSALGASLLVGPQGTSKVRLGNRGRGLHKGVLRDAFSVLLGAATITAVVLTYFGDRLDPRVAGETAASSMTIDVRLPHGTTLAQTLSTVERIERGLRRVPGIRRFTSIVEGGSAQVDLELEPEMSEGGRRRMFLMYLHSYVSFVPGMISLEDRSSGRAVRFTDDFELTPLTDEDASVYRVLLKGTDAEAIRRSFDLVVSRLTRLGIRIAAIQSEWRRPTARAALIPRPGTDRGETLRVASRLTELTQPPVAFRTRDGARVTVLPLGAPRSADVVPQRADVVAREPSIPSRFVIRDEFVPGGATRELGRFVMPIRIAIPLQGDERLKKREEIDRTLSTMVLPAGIVLERPSLSKWTFSLPKLRLFALAAFVPLLLFAAAAIALASLRGALAALAATLVGFAVAAPSLELAEANVDELTLLSMAAAVCCTTAIGVVALLRAREETRAAYRAQRRFAPPAVLVVLPVVTLLAVPAFAPNAARDGWRAPMLAAMTILAAGIPSSMLVAPAIGFVARDIRRRRTPVARAASHPAEWLVLSPSARPQAREALPPSPAGRGQTSPQAASGEGPVTRDSSASPHLSIRNLTKRYGDGFRALQRVSFDLSPGIIGLLGPNGAGKTTLLRVMTGLLLPTRGQLLYRGVAVGPHNLAEYRRLIGFLPQEFNAYAGLTAADFLDYWALERGMNDARVRRAEIERLLEVVGLSQDATRRVRDFSGGMRQRIGIARALLGDPPLLVVDEPTTGLDLESRNRFRDVLATLAGERIIVLSTHIAGDVEATASRILLLTRGTLRWDGTPAALIDRARGRVFEDVVSEKDARELTLRFRVTTRKRVAGGVHVRGVVPARTPLPGPPTEPSLEEAYLAEVAADRAMRVSGFAFLFDKPDAA